MFDTSPDHSFRDIFDNYVRLHRASAAMQRQLDLVIRLMAEDIAVTHPSQLNTDKQVLWRDMVLNRAKSVTWNNYRRHVQVLLRYAVAKKLIVENPWEVSSEPVEDVAPKTVNIDRLNDIIASLSRDGSRIEPHWFWLAVLRTLFMTGIRRRQLLGLTWEDVDFTENHIVLRSKTSKTRREWSVPMMPAVAEDLRILRAKTRATVGEEYLRDGQVFNLTLFLRRRRNPKLKQMNEWHLANFFRALKKHHAFKASPHKVRHTFATELAKTGRIKTLQRILGHRDVRTTFCYVHPDMDEMRDLMTNLGTKRARPPVVDATVSRE
ncbi:MAG: site-specific integrase [Nevskiaceae bacterium]|nr:MAG: site-specific integrase [Nevskiaceae bacterium]